MLEPGSFGWEYMGLRVIDHLEPVLEAAQRLTGGPNAQLLDPATPNQLLGLCEKFDFPDPAAAGLNIMAFNGDSPAPQMRVDLALDRVDVLDRREIEVFSPEKGSELLQKAPPRNKIACHRPGLYERSALPVLPDAFVVSERRRDRYRQRCGGRVGAESEIGTKHISITRALLQNAHQLACQAHEKSWQAVARAGPDPRCVVQNDQVDIARIIELISAEFSQAQHQKTAVLFGLVRIGKRDEPLSGRFAQ